MSTVQCKVAPIRGPMKAYSNPSTDSKVPMKSYDQSLLSKMVPPAPMNSATDVEVAKKSEERVVVEEIGESTKAVKTMSSAMKKQQGDSYITPKSLVASIKKFPTAITPEAQQMSRNFASVLPKRRTSIPASNQRRIMTAQPANRRNSTPTCSSPRSRRNSPASSKGKIIGYDYHGRPQYENSIVKTKGSSSTKKKFSDKLYTENWVKNYSSPLNIFPSRRPHTTAVEKRSSSQAEKSDKPTMKLVSKKPQTVKYNSSGRLTTKIAPRYLIPSSSVRREQLYSSGSDMSYDNEVGDEYASDETNEQTPSCKRYKRGFD